MEHGILSRAAEFAHFRRISIFCGIFRNSALADDKEAIYGILWFGSGSRRKLFIICRHDCTIKDMTATRALTGGILKMLILSEILPVYLVGRLLYLLVTVTGDRYAYLVGFRRL